MNLKVTKEQIIEYITNHSGCTVTEIASHFLVQPRTIFYKIGPFLQQELIVKKGTPPHVQYYINTNNNKKNETIFFTPPISRLLEQERYQISKTGKELIGVNGFIEWCHERKQDPIQASIRRSQHINYIDSISLQYGIDATNKLNDYPGNHLKELRYGHIYALPEFGKTKHGTWIEIAKTYPSAAVFKKLVDSIIPFINHLIQDKHIDSLCFVQPTAKRSLQIMDYLKKNLRTDLPRIALQKTPGYSPAQKTLKHRDDRIANARASFEVKDNNHYNHTLIIDDAVGSGATIIEISNKLLSQGVSTTTIGFSVVGTANGIFEQMKNFEVLANV